MQVNADLDGLRLGIDFEYAVEISDRLNVSEERKTASGQRWTYHAWRPPTSGDVDMRIQEEISKLSTLVSAWLILLAHRDDPNAAHRARRVQEHVKRHWPMLNWAELKPSAAERQPVIKRGALLSVEARQKR